MRWLLLVSLSIASTEPAVPDPEDDLAGVGGELSPAGQRGVAALREGHAQARGVTWDVSDDNAFAPDWLVQTPVAAYWGQPAAALPLATSCAGDPRCDADFDLRACEVQADCTFGGTCTAVAATVAHPGDVARQLCVGHSAALYDQLYSLLVTARSSIELSTLPP